MNIKQVAQEILQENYPIECETVGPTNLQDIVDAEVSFSSAEHGSYMDLGDAIGTLVIAATFVKTVVDIVVAAKKELGREPGKDEIEIRIVTKKETIQKLDKETRERLVKAVIKKIKEKST